MRRAWITLRHQPPYRADAFADGFEALDFKPELRFPQNGEVAPDDVVITWNLNPRYRGAFEIASAAGAAILVAENGYIRGRGTADPFYAIARNGHNGSGFWYVKPEDRWTPLGHRLAPWRKGGDYVLIANQRGIGSQVMACPRNFADTTQKRVRHILAKSDMRNYPVRTRDHPGRHKDGPPLSEDLAGASAVVTWGSNVANLALLQGIPTFRLAPYHVNSAAHVDLNLLPDPPETDRLAGFHKLAWAQWSLPEVRSGDAFRVLLEDVL